MNGQWYLFASSLFCCILISKYVGSSVRLHIYSGNISRSKIKKCCRFKVYQIAEKCHAKVRANSDDGIYYVGDSKDLTVQVVFEEQQQYEDFQSEMKRLPLQYRKRKSLDESVVTDIVVNEMSHQVEMVDYRGINRIFEDQYQKIENEAIVSSEDCDGLSEMNESYVSTVYLTDAVILKLFDKVDSSAMYKTKPEKCHLKSQSKYADDAKNPNNIVYMSRFLHEHFDGISKINYVPTFLVQYMRHSEQFIRMAVDGRDVDVGETTVRIVFKTEEDKNVLCPYFRDYSVVSSTEIEFMLYFENPTEFSVFSKFKENLTRELWRKFGDDD